MGCATSYLSQALQEQLLDLNVNTVCGGSSGAIVAAMLIAKLPPGKFSNRTARIQLLK